MKKIGMFTIVFLCFSVFTSMVVFAQTNNQNSAISDISYYEGYTITNIEIQGLNIITQDEILMMLPVNVNDKVDSYYISKIIDILYSSGYFENIVVEIKPEGDQNVKLIIKVVEYPLISEINISGNKKIKTDDINEVITLTKGDFYSPFALKKQINAIKNLYLEKGFKDVEITSKIELAFDKNKPLPGYINIIIEIKEPKRIKITKIDFKGNTVFKPLELRLKMETKTFLRILFEFRDGVFLQSTFDSDLEKIKKMYYSKGYIDVEIVNIDKKVIELDDEIHLEITIEIKEGDQYTFGGLEIKGNKLFDTKEILDKIQIVEKKEYDRPYFNAIKEKIRSFYSSYGFIYAVIILEEKIDKENKTVKVEISIKENDRAHIKNIYVKGNTKTKDYVILRELMFSEGEVFNAQKITQSLYNLYNTQFFSALDLQVKPTDYMNLVDLIIIVEEAPTGSLNMGGFFNPSEGWAGFGITEEYTEKNLFGMGFNISESADIAPLSSVDISFNFYDKWFLNKPLVFGLSLSYEYGNYSDKLMDSDQNGVPDPFSTLTDYQQALEDNSDYYTDNPDYLMDYDYHTFSLSFYLGKRWIPYMTLVGGWYLGSTIYVPDVEGQIPYLSSSTVGAIANVGEWWWKHDIYAYFDFDNRDYTLLPTKGIWFRQRFDYYGGILGGDSQFIKSKTLFNFNFSLFWGISFHMTNLLGIIFNQFDGTCVVDTSSYLYLSGYNETRGWMGLSSLLGRLKYSMISEFEKELVPQLLSAVLFFDAGTIYQSPDDLFGLSIFDLFYSYGLGLKLQIQAFPIRMYFAKRFTIESNWQITDYNPGFFNWQFVFTIGDFMF